MLTAPRKQTAILVVDDEAAIRDSLGTWLGEEGFQVEAVPDGPAALARLEAVAFDIILLDIRMPGMDGLEVLQHLRSRYPDPVVIMLTAFGSVEIAVQALKLGAHDFIAKPFDLDDLGRIIQSAVRRRSLGAGERQPDEHHDAPSELVGCSLAMQHLLELVATVAPTGASVLIRGEPGTGKELVARTIHARSPRQAGPFLTLSCGAVPAEQLEGELFGVEPDGADRPRPGRLELASGGTLFLDEVGTMPPHLQLELLRVLEAGRLRRRGGKQEVDIDPRVISATSADLEVALRGGRFREDLFYRLGVFRIEIPPLRSRVEDILPLARHFIGIASASLGTPVHELPLDCVRLLEQYRWPGNVRELRGVIERAVVLAGPQPIERSHLRFQFPELGPGGDTLDSVTLGTESLASVERAHIQRVLRVHEGNITRSARVLGIDRATLYAKIKKYGIER
jgi:two-component system response regulator HydG